MNTENGVNGPNFKRRPSMEINISHLTWNHALPNPAGLARHSSIYSIFTGDCDMENDGILGIILHCLKAYNVVIKSDFYTFSIILLDVHVIRGQSQDRAFREHARISLNLAHREPGMLFCLASIKQTAKQFRLTWSNWLVKLTGQIDWVRMIRKGSQKSFSC